MRTSVRAVLVLSAQVMLCPGETPEHWAFKAPARPELPVPTDRAIDFLIERWLTEAGVERLPQAAAHTLIRRLSWDLRGLPPSPEEVVKFVADGSPEAWSELVEEFLNSPHFGERMAQNWLDLARFADTSGYAADRTRNVWPYRDWVIDAINKNMPFDQFTVEQLAGDMLPGATPEQRLATGFHRQAMQAKGNNPRKEEFRIKGIVDRLETTGRTWLGLSLECAECHDHMYDPISQREYYELFAVFNNVPHLGSGYNTHGPRMRYRPKGFRGERARLEAEIARLVAEGPAFELPSAPGALLGSWAGPAVAEDAERYSVRGDFTISATIETDRGTGTIVSKNDWRGGQRSYVFGIGAEGDRNGKEGHLFGWISAKTAPWDGVEIYGSFPVNDGERHDVALVFRVGKSVHLLVDGVPDHQARILGRVPGSVAKSERRLSVGASYDKSPKPVEFPFVGSLSEVRLYGEAAEVPANVELGRLRARLEEITPKEIEVPVMEELEVPRETRVLLRGDFKQLGDRVTPGVPSALPPLVKDGPVDRLDFARWLVRDDHPLTSRVAANYLWQHFFGIGIVSTPADFGTQGSPPSHPDLLDWLAVEFVESGWDRKHLVRLIVNSKAYRRASKGGDAADMPFAAMPRQRLPAEQVRDHFLAVSGLFNPWVGGPSVFPVQPDGFYEERGQNEAANSNFVWRVSEGDARYRKSMYIYWKRMALHPSMAAFDAPPRQVCVARRTTTNTPLQALVTLNDPMFDECSRAFAARVIRETPDGGRDAQIRRAFQLCLSRDPDAEELAKFREFFEAGSWHEAAAVLLNLDEALTRE